MAELAAQAFLSSFANAQVNKSGFVPPPPASQKRLVYRAWNATRAPARLNATDTTSAEDRIQDLRQGIAKLLVLIGATTDEPVQGQSLSYTVVRRWMTFIGTAAHNTLGPHVGDVDVSEGLCEIDATVANAIYTFDNLVVETGESALADGDRGDIFSPRWANVLAEATRLAKILALPEVGKTAGLVPVEWAGVGSDIRRAGYYALIVFLCGRPVGAKTDAISVNRPRNLEQKYHGGVPVPELSGSCKMSRGTWLYVGQAWTLDGCFRAAYFLPLIPLARSVQDPVRGSIGMMVALCEMAQLAHVTIMADFIESYSWIYKIPELEGELRKLKADAGVWETFPAYARSYMKMIMQDQFKAYDSKKFPRLLKLAVDVLSNEDRSLIDYAVKGADQGIRAKFDALRAAEEATNAPALPPAAPPAV